MALGVVQGSTVGRAPREKIAKKRWSSFPEEAAQEPGPQAETKCLEEDVQNNGRGPGVAGLCAVERAS